ncbi:helix-turn-helix domain-containing protein [Dyadobacter tibetensis]|uniref:helix-turn-helix domain-containing protein n=1 Tax=Dyadobacter tibetensis TaxID=1211851 RepID=UPI00046FBD16|nr:helix-turn-helix domain-containing protein [Dyadobacter tibetensis]
MVHIRTFENEEALFTPQRLLKYVLIWCESGHLSIVIDEKVFELKSYEALTITSGQYHYFKKLENAKGFVLDFTLDFFCKKEHDIELIFENGLFCHFDMNEIISIDNHLLLNEQLKIIQEELRSKPYQYLTSIHSRIELVLIEINRSKLKRGDEIWKPDALFLKFLELVRNNFDKNYQLKKIAEKLNTTELILNEQSKLHTGRTAQKVISGLIVSEAKRLLQYENLSIKEIAFRLGFKDPYYFSNFFKKHTDLSPKAYKRDNVI